MALEIPHWRAIILVAASLIPRLAFGETAQTTFEFHSGFWVNLHHVLYNQGVGRKAGRAPNLLELNPAEIADWNEALDYYGLNLANHDFLELSMTRINGSLAVAGDSLKSSGIPAPVIRALERAAPIYRAHWWTEHNSRNQEWIDQVTPLIARYEKTLRPALAHAYHVRWPNGRIRVEMSYYTTGAAAYTSLGPTLITISSWSQRNQGSAGVETIFHEAGHSLVQKVRDEIGAAENRSGKKLSHQDLWHAVMFYTTGELVRQQLPEVIPYAIKYGMWEKNWPNTLPVMEEDWKPFLDGRGRFRDSIDRLVADLD